MDCIAPKLIWPHRSIDEETDDEKPVSVRCGKCLPCLMDKRNDWSFRLEQEFKYCKRGAMFLTLTYDQKHLPSDLSVSKRDVQLFMKRLRKRDQTNSLRYFAVGEYGSRFRRPHYHILLFGAVESDVRSAWIDSKGNPIGIVHVGRVTSASVAYVTKYIVQSDSYVDGREKPFTLMSRKYGIGGKYLTDEMVAWHREDDRNYAVRDGKKIRLPRFYKEKIFHNKEQKERMRKKNVIESIKAKELERAFWETEYGAAWCDRKKEAVDRVLSRVQQKVKFSQIL